MPDIVHVTTIPESLGFFTGHIRHLRAHGFRVAAVTSPGEYAEHLREAEQLEVHAVPMARTIRPASDLLSLYRLWRLLSSLKPDIVHSHTPKAGLIGTLAARLAHVRVVFVSIFGLPQMTRSGYRRVLLDTTTRVACAAAHRVWCDSRSVRDYLVSHRLCPARKIVVFGQGSVDGVDARGTFSPARAGGTERAAVRRRHGIPDHALVIGYVGRVVRDKGIHELLLAWLALREDYADLHLLVVGPLEPVDPLLPDDERVLRSDDRVHLAGSQRDVAGHYAAMDVFVMPSYREGFGISNIEAAAMSLPVVSTRIPGCVDSVADGVTGTLVPPRDGGALKRSIEQYLRDPDLARRHGEAGRARVLAEYVPESLRESLRAEYLRLLAAC